MKVNLCLNTFLMIYHFCIEKGKRRVFFLSSHGLYHSLTLRKKGKKHKKRNNFFSPRHSNFSHQYKRLQYRSQHAQLSVMFISGSQYWLHYYYRFVYVRNSRERVISALWNLETVVFKGSNCVSRKPPRDLRSLVSKLRRANLHTKMFGLYIGKLKHLWWTL